MPKKILLINPNYYDDIFAQSKVRAAIGRGITPMGLLTIAAPLLQKGHDVKLLDLNLLDASESYLREQIQSFRPDVVGITSTTPLIRSLYKVAALTKSIDPSILVIAGGPHPSALPKDVLQESEVDGVVRGEGDFIFTDIVERGLTTDIPNLFFKQNGSIVESPIQNAGVDDLDSLPFPAYELLGDLSQYHQPKISSRESPLGYLETSRGCFGRCTYCNKNIFGFKVRKKSPKRVVDEMERMLRLGFKEIHIIDDIFSADNARAMAICDEIMARNLHFSWYPRGGLRVDTVNEALFKKMKKAGCYRVPFGIESGSPRVLKVIRKGITLDIARRALRDAKKAKLETECYFMIGHPTETPEDVRLSIEFAKELDPDYCKFAILIPLPGTILFDDMKKQGLIQTLDWEKYNFSVAPRDIYKHDTMTWKEIEDFYRDSHRAFYFRLRPIVKTFIRTLANGTIWGHIHAFLKTRW